MEGEPTPRAHLLTLPRELRDEIYTYLSHDLILEEIPKAGGVHAKIYRAPILNVLLVHSTLHEEYLASDIFKQLTITVHRELRPSKAALMKAQLGGALAHVRHLVFTAYPVEWAWVSGFIDHVLYDMPKLCALSVLTKNPGGSHISTIPPRSLAGLPLVQRGVGSQSEYYRDNGNMPGGSMTLGPENSTHHVVNGIGFYLFARDRIEDYMWTGYRVLHELGPYTYQLWRRTMLTGGRPMEWAENDENTIPARNAPSSSQDKCQ
ncbi:hypothetical protein PTNB73_06706 [Pyrenophora teres f. teres]|nr:hypothetical protein PTNB73_06706 [Pyrenophora teres f. teres]